MVRVRVRFLPWLSERLGAGVGTHLLLEELVDDGTTVRRLLDGVQARLPELGRLTGGRGLADCPDEVTLVLNDRLVDLVPGGLDAVLAEGDEIAVLSSFAGG